MGSTNLFSGLAVPALTEDKWILGNPGWYGFYRVNYDEYNWDLLGKQLDAKHEVSF